MNLSPIHNFYHAQLTGATLVSQDSYTMLLAHFDGTQGSKTFIDSSSYARGMTSFNAAHISTTQSQFGGASYKSTNVIAGSKDQILTRDIVSCNDSADWFLSTGSFSIDFWANISDNGTARIVVGQYQDATNWYGCYVQGASTPTNGYVGFGALDAAAWTVNIYASHSIPSGTWAHYAIVRIDGANSVNSWRMYVNGESKPISLAVGAYNGTIKNYSGPLYIGSLLYNYGNDYLGYLDELRFSKGVARWTSSTFSVPTSAY